MMRSNRYLGSALLVVLSGCAAPQSTFAFDLGGDVSERVQSFADVSGEVDNAGFLSLDDASWGIRMNLGGLAPGGRAAVGETGELVIESKVTGDVFSTKMGGACTVWIDPHEATNGSTVTGLFTCTGLESNGGKVVEVNGGRFATYLNDTANNPRVEPPTPGA